ncbi:MAG TPA: hypothetical protein GXZ82_11420 [Firmicutes bacterium]|nr:hypothetical protein [Bacillota bacterium]
MTTNSPGEVAAWLTPTVRALRHRAPQARISVFVPPCTFAGGAECRVIRRMPWVDQVYGPAEFVRYALFGIKPAGFAPGPTGVVCFLGGDLLYAAWLAKRLRYPAIAYNEGRVRLQNVYRKFLMPDAQARQRALAAGGKAEQIEVIGDLMLDAIRPTVADRVSAKAMLGVGDRGYVVSLFPGSRPYELQAMLPFMLRAAELIACSVEQPVHFLISLAPFVDHEALVQAAGSITPGFEGVTATVEQDAPLSGGHTGSVGVWRLCTAKVRATAYQGLQYDIMQAGDVAVTIPGSNTAEMAGLGVPMVVVFPLNKPEALPLEGLPGVIGRIPGIGPALKKQVVAKAAAKIKYVAWPNRKANQMLTPEIKGYVRPEDVAIPVVELLRRDEKREAIGAKLRAVMGAPGAAGRLAEHILTHVGSTR